MAKQSAAKGAKKGRRFGQGRSETAKRRCAERKQARRMAQEVREVRNAHLREIGRLTPWEEAKAKRYAKRHGIQS